MKHVPVSALNAVVAYSIEMNKHGPRYNWAGKLIRKTSGLLGTLLTTLLFAELFFASFIQG